MSVGVCVYIEICWVLPPYSNSLYNRLYYGPLYGYIYIYIYPYCEYIIYNSTATEWGQYPTSLYMT